MNAFTCAQETRRRKRGKIPRYESGIRSEDPKSTSVIICCQLLLLLSNVDMSYYIVVLSFHHLHVDICYV